MVKTKKKKDGRRVGKMRKKSDGRDSINRKKLDLNQKEDEITEDKAKKRGEERTKKEKSSKGKVKGKKKSRADDKDTLVEEEKCYEEKTETLNTKEDDETKNKGIKERKQQNYGDEYEDDEDIESVYSINSLEDYFRAVQDLFVEFRGFVNSTDKTLNTALNAIKEIIPMIIQGRIDHKRIADILDMVNDSLKDYLKNHRSLIKKVSALNHALRNRKEVEDMILDFLLRAIGGNVYFQAIEPRGDEEIDLQPSKGLDDSMVPSVILEDEKTTKELEEKFGIKIDEGFSESEDGVESEEKQRKKVGGNKKRK